MAGNLVWIQGPYPSGKYTNIKIFSKVLRNFLEPGERVEADEGYRGHADKIKCRGKSANPVENEAMQRRVRAHHETLNGQLKNWGILSQFFCRHITMHGDVFGMRGGDAAHHWERCVRSHHVVLRLGVDAHHARVTVGDLLAIRVFVEKDLHI